MKSVARSYFWWPGLDSDIEECAQSCIPCQSVKNAPPVAPLHPWLWPARPWQRLHVDFAGPFMGRMYLIIIDAHSKWPEVIEMHTTTAQKTIYELRRLFASYGLPEQIVTDNGPQFVSEEFAAFMKINGVKHIKCSPYHPSSNGTVERFVQTFKKAMKASVNSPLSLNQRLLNFLLTYRITPHATTNEAPCKLFLNRMVRTRLDLLRPNRDKHVCDKQAEQKAHHDKHATSRVLEVGQRVMVRDQRPRMPWVPGTVKEQLGPLTYLIQTDSGFLWTRHLDHLRKLGDTAPVPDASPSEQESSGVDAYPPADNTLPVTPSSTNPLNPAGEPSPHLDDATQTSSTAEQLPSTETNHSRRYPQREHNPPQRYM